MTTPARIQPEITLQRSGRFGIALLIGSGIGGHGLILLTDVLRLAIRDAHQDQRPFEQKQQRDRQKQLRSGIGRRDDCRQGDHQHHDIAPRPHQLIASDGRYNQLYTLQARI